MSVPVSPPTQGSAPSSDGSPLRSDLVAPHTREVLRRLELDVTMRLDGLLHGDHSGLVPGHGTELGETRRYGPGDDVRRIDWNVSARLSEPYIRQTIAEHELETWLVVDRSPRLDFGTAKCEKRDLALSAAAAMGFLTNRDGNRLGALLLGRDQSETIPAKGSRKHLMRILHQMADTPRSDGAGVTNLAEGLHHLGALAKRRGMVAVISDFQVAPGWELPLQTLARRHDVIAVEVVDPRELELPNVGLLTTVDPATGAIREIPTHKKSVRDAYAQAAEARRSALADTFTEGRIDHLVLRTDEDWLDAVVRFVGARKYRLGSGQAALAAQGGR